MLLARVLYLKVYRMCLCVCDCKHLTDATCPLTLPPACMAVRFIMPDSLDSFYMFLVIPVGRLRAWYLVAWSSIMSRECIFSLSVCRQNAAKGNRLLLPFQLWLEVFGMMYILCSCSNIWRSIYCLTIFFTQFQLSQESIFVIATSNCTIPIDSYCLARPFRRVQFACEQWRALES